MRMIKQLLTRVNRLWIEIDPKVLYMKRRRDKLKAWFNIYFSIRVPEDFYKERQHIFNSFPWEENAYINTVFSKLSEL